MVLLSPQSTCAVLGLKLVFLFLALRGAHCWVANNECFLLGAQKVLCSKLVLDLVHEQVFFTNIYTHTHIHTCTHTYTHNLYPHAHTRTRTHTDTGP